MNKEIDWESVDAENAARILNRRAAEKAKREEMRWKKMPKTHRESTRNDHGTRIKKYGITSADYAELLRRQKHGCAICELPTGKRRLSVDHDHATGRVRGLLCDHCNRSLGGFKDDVVLLRRAALYLERLLTPL